MPVTSNIGYSQYTALKHKGLRDILRWHNKKRDDYLYIDTNAGCGKYNGHTGSPLIFLEECKGKALFIEKDYFNWYKLKNIVLHEKNVTVVCGDNSKVIKERFDISTKQYGLCFIDHNGIPPFNLISFISKKLPNIDLLVNCPTTIIKRSRVVHKTKSLIEYIQMINKKYIYFKKPSKDKFKWTMLLCSNKKLHCKRLDFKSIYDRDFISLNYTKKELGGLICV